MGRILATLLGLGLAGFAAVGDPIQKKNSTLQQAELSLPPEILEAQRTAQEAQRKARAMQPKAIEAQLKAQQRAREASGHKADGPKGVGTLTISTGSETGKTYLGEYRDGRPQGYGVVNLSDAERVEGEWHYTDNAGGNPDGIFVYSRKPVEDVQRLILEVHQAGASVGVLVLKGGGTVEGSFAHDGRGVGVITYADGRRYEGQWRIPERDGLGVMLSATGEVVEAGTYSHDRLVGER